MKITCKDTHEVVFSYREYLTTQHWKNLRARAFQKSEGVCVCCERPLDLGFVAHHRNYEVLGRERVRLEYSKNYIKRAFQKLLKDDVIAVCNHCHNGTGENHLILHEGVRVPSWARIEPE